MYYMYDENYMYIGTSQHDVPYSTHIPYPSVKGFFYFSYGNWQPVFGADNNGDLTIVPSEMTARTEQLLSSPVEDITVNPLYSDLSLQALEALFVAAEPIVTASKLYKTYGHVQSYRSYGLYKKGTTSYYGVGFTWVTEHGRIFNAKVINGVITDFYEIFNTGTYSCKELHADTFEPVALYIEDGNKKLDPVTLEVLQINVLTTGLIGVPREFADEILERGLPYANRIWQYGNKPYGEIVAFYV